MFVLVVVGIALAWSLRCEDKQNTPYPKDAKMSTILKQALLQPEIFFIGFFTGIFRWTNFWDFPIYFVVGGCVVFFVNICIYRKSLKQYAITTFLQAAEVLAIGWAASLPFTSTFDAMAGKIQLTHSHSAFYQLLVLWGLPFAICIGFVIFCIRSYCKRKSAGYVSNVKVVDGKPKKKSFIGFFCHLQVPDLFVLLMSLCAM